MQCTRGVKGGCGGRSSSFGFAKTPNNWAPLGAPIQSLCVWVSRRVTDPRACIPHTTHTLAQTHTHTHTHTRTGSRLKNPKRIHTHNHSCARTHTLTHTRATTPKHTHIQTRSIKHTLTHSIPHTYACAFTQTRADAPLPPVMDGNDAFGGSYSKRSKSISMVDAKSIAYRPPHEASA
jgi:hypothetical protein